MTFNDLLNDQGIDPQGVVAFRHRPKEPQLNKVLPWLAAERPALFNAYQQTQSEKVEARMAQSTHIASFIGHAPGKALFIGLYSVKGSRPLTREQFWKSPLHLELGKHGMRGFVDDSTRQSVLFFDLALTGFCSAWKGKLIVGWPPPERSWWRRAHRNDLPVLAIREESALDARIPDWLDIVLSWADLSVLPTSWQAALSQWRGIYYIFDTADGKGYVGSAYGHANILGRWKTYASTGHGGNRLLRQRDPGTFRFSILQRVSPDMDADDVIRVEASWKERLHTRAPFGLNDN